MDKLIRPVSQICSTEASLNPLHAGINILDVGGELPALRCAMQIEGCWENLLAGRDQRGSRKRHVISAEDRLLCNPHYGEAIDSIPTGHPGNQSAP